MAGQKTAVSRGQRHYIPKIGRLGQIGAQMQYGFMAMTPEWLFFIPQLTHTRCAALEPPR